jgi:hypothetical protein
LGSIPQQQIEMLALRHLRSLPAAAAFAVNLRSTQAAATVQITQAEWLFRILSQFRRNVASHSKFIAD